MQLLMHYLTPSLLTVIAFFTHYTKKNWMIDHQSDLEIDAQNELFPSSSPRHLFNEQTSYYIPPPGSNIRSVVHGDDGDMIQISMDRLYKGVKVVDSRATATIKRGNLINIGIETWGDINPDFNVEPRLVVVLCYLSLIVLIVQTKILTRFIFVTFD